MKYTIEAAEKSCVKMQIDFNKEDWDNAINKAYQKTKSKYNVQGFRKGHVPFSVLVGQYGKEIFYEDAVNIAISDAYPVIMEKEGAKINPVGDPDFKLDDFTNDGLKVTAMIPVMPEVKLGEYKGIKVDKVEYNVSDADVEKDIERLLDRNSREVAVTDRAAKEGDTVVIDYSGSVDGVKFDGGTAEKQRLSLGSHQFIPGFEEQIVGLKIGEEKDILVTFPDDYTDELKGKQAVFAIKLHEIFYKELPELNDEFIKESTGEESLEAYKNKVKDNLSKDAMRRARDENEDKLLTAIADATEVDIPDCMISDEIDNMIRQLEYRLMYQGLKFEDYLKITNQTADALKETYKESAATRVKKQLVVNTIIEKEKIEASQKEVDEKIAEQAKSVSKEVDEYRKTMDPRQIDYIRNSIVVEKLFAFLTENNIFVQKQIDDKA